MGRRVTGVTGIVPVTGIGSGIFRRGLSGTLGVGVRGVSRVPECG